MSARTPDFACPCLNVELRVEEGSSELNPTPFGYQNASHLREIGKNRVKFEVEDFLPPASDRGTDRDPFFAATDGGLAACRVLKRVNSTLEISVDVRYPALLGRRAPEREEPTGAESPTIGRCLVCESDVFGTAESWMKDANSRSFGFKKDLLISRNLLVSEMERKIKNNSQFQVSS